MSGKRTFDDEKALESAMGVFWKKGYAGASLAELTQSMGINKPSMYRTFGNKEALFLKATQRYIEKNAQPHFVHLQQEGIPLAQRIKNYMTSVVSEQCTQKIQDALVDIFTDDPQAIKLGLNTRAESIA